MKYTFNISINGEVDEQPNEGITDIQKVVLDSFPHDLLAGVTVKGCNIMVHQQPEYPAGAQTAQGAVGVKY